MFIILLISLFKTTVEKRMMWTIFKIIVKIINQSNRLNQLRNAQNYQLFCLIRFTIIFLSNRCSTYCYSVTPRSYYFIRVRNMLTIILSIFNNYYVDVRGLCYFFILIICYRNVLRLSIFCFTIPSCLKILEIYY